MKIGLGWMALVAAGCMTIGALGQSTPPRQSAPMPMPEETPEARREAEALLRETVETYRAGRALTDTLTITIDFAAYKQTMSFEIAMDANSAKVASDNMIIVARDGMVYIQDVNRPRKYVGLDVKTTTEEALRQQGIGAPFHFAVRGENPPDFEGVLQAMNAGGQRGFKVRDVSRIRTEKGEDRVKIALVSPGSTMDVNIDPATHFIREIVSTQGSEGNTDYGRIIMTLDPALHDTLPEPVTFDTAGKKKVATMRDLATGVGDEAPEFSLQSSDGTTVTLSALRGNVVVLDFWATWCQPCIMGLPKLDEFNQWAKTSGKPVKVFAVNVWERQETPEQRRDAALGFWSAKKFSMPTLLDLDRAVASAYSFQSIPTTVIVGPDGTIRRMHNGFSQDMVQLLKDDVEEILGEAGPRERPGS